MSIEGTPGTKKGTVLLVTVGLAWLAIVVTGMAVFMQYENSAGVSAEAPGDWPAESQIQRVKSRAVLIVLVHPHCPCTRATISELARLMARVGDRLDAHVVFTKPEGVAQGWERTDIWTSAAQIPRVNVVSDDEGVESQLFGARTSGQSLLYDKSGKLVFSGGITIGRGAEGDSVGAAAIASFVTDETGPAAATRVFGCQLFADESYCRMSEEPPNAEPTR